MEQTTQMDSWYPLPVKIAGTGHYLPKRKISSSELEAEYGLKEGWCVENSGFRERRWVEDETPSIMGAEAAKEALANAGIDPQDLDLILNASGTGNFERLVPDAGPLIQHHLNLSNSGIPSYTLQNTWLSFLTALEVSAGMIAIGHCETILIVCPEIISRNLDMNNPEVYTRFADGAAAVVLTLATGEETGKIHKSISATYGETIDYMQSQFGKIVLQEEGITPEDLMLKMDAKSFKKYGFQYTQNIIEKLLKEYPAGKIKQVIPQQFGKDFLEYVNRLIPGNKIAPIMDTVGFCGAASIPLALHEAVKQETVRRGDLFLMVGLGAGLSVGAAIMTY
jgi:3-oxoacyl-[acyl-carrier-protein] synthase III